jgi:hypothetical protein
MRKTCGAGHADVFGCFDNGSWGTTNCGAAGATCFMCVQNGLGGPAPTWSFCAPSGDYCAPSCGWNNLCAGCCWPALGGSAEGCLHGDTDDYCGSGGASCVKCPVGQHCLNQTCVLVSDGGVVDGGTD